MLARNKQADLGKFGIVGSDRAKFLKRFFSHQFCSIDSAGEQ